MPDFGWNEADQAYANLADVIAGIGEGLQHAADGAMAAIDKLVHDAAVGLLNSALPPMVHGHNAVLRSGAWMRMEALTAALALVLTDARFNNAALSGAVAQAVEKGVDRITTDLDYAQAVNSIT